MTWRANRKTRTKYRTDDQLDFDRVVALARGNVSPEQINASLEVTQAPIVVAEEIDGGKRRVCRVSASGFLKSKNASGLNAKTSATKRLTIETEAC